MTDTKKKQETLYITRDEFADVIRELMSRPHAGRIIELRIRRITEATHSWELNEGNP